MHAERILFIRLWGLGDVILCTPAVHAARAAFPRARIEFLTGRAGADALTGNPDIDDIIVVRHGMLPMLQAVREVRRRRYDVVIDLHSTARTAYFVGVSGARHRIGFRGRGPRRALYTAMRARGTDGAYTALELLRMLELLGLQTWAEPDLALRIDIPRAEQDWADTFFRTHGLDGARVAALSPVSLHAYKQWGAEPWARVADTLIEAGVRVVLTHGPGEREQVAEVVGRMRHEPLWDVVPPNVRALAALFRRAGVWAGNDGGPKHVAVAAGAATVTVCRHTVGAPWTDTRPGQPHVFIERPPPQGCDFRCSRCAHLGCLRAVDDADVSSMVLDTLVRRGGFTPLRAAPPRPPAAGGSR